MRNPLESIRAVFSKGGEKRQSGQETGLLKTHEVVDALRPVAEELDRKDPACQPIIFVKRDGSSGILRWGEGKSDEGLTSLKVLATFNLLTGITALPSVAGTGWVQIEHRTDYKSGMLPEEKVALAARCAQSTLDNPNDMEGCIKIPIKAQSEAK